MVAPTEKRSVRPLTSCQLPLACSGATNAALPRKAPVAVVSDPAMRKLNRDFHGCDEPTDVLAFALGGAPSAAPAGAFDGEVIVSIDTARTEARARSVSLESELLLYVVHGTLHLMGEDDHSPAAYRRMHARALAILAALGHSNTIDPPAAKLGPKSPESHAP